MSQQTSCAPGAEDEELDDARGGVAINHEGTNSKLGGCEATAIPLVVDDLSSGCKTSVSSQRPNAQLVDQNPMCNVCVTGLGANRARRLRG